MNKLGLRERKKLQTHNDIIEAAWKLFSEKGFNDVKVAEIADKANISVKTLFTYFNSKEDIVFAGENELIDKIILEFNTRDQNKSLIETEKDLIFKLIRDEKEMLNLEENLLIKIISTTPSINSRLLLMWKNYEIKLATALKNDSRLDLPEIQSNIIAINLITPFRLIFDLMINNKLGSTDIDAELNNLFFIIENGLNNI